MADFTNTLASGLRITDIEVGSGPEARAGQRLELHYRGMLENGKQFDASYDRGKPFTFQLRLGQVIKGWDEGVQGMKVGGKRILVIPPELGYGSRGAGGVIPPNETLIFEVELISVDGMRNVASPLDVTNDAESLPNNPEIGLGLIQPEGVSATSDPLINPHPDVECSVSDFSEEQLQANQVTRNKSFATSEDNIIYNMTEMPESGKNTIFEFDNHNVVVNTYSSNQEVRGQGFSLCDLWESSDVSDVCNWVVGNPY